MSDETPPTAEAATTEPRPPLETDVAAGAQRTSDPLRSSRTSGLWSGVVLLVVLLGLLAVFVMQNTQSVEVRFLGWTGSAPLAASLLIATASGLLLAVVAGTLRILQLRRRVRRERKR